MEDWMVLGFVGEIGGEERILRIRSIANRTQLG
jgi:hypothetical protein